MTSLPVPDVAAVGCGVEEDSCVSIRLGHVHVNGVAEDTSPGG